MFNILKVFINIINNQANNLESKHSAIALNSSYPKVKLYADSPMITRACRESEERSIKDMLYAVGYTKKSTLKSLWLIYGDCFCAKKETYERIKDTISNGINTIADVEFTETKELGKVKKVDPLGITDLRILGMWYIENPNKIFSYIYEYNSLPSKDREGIESLGVKVKSSDNPVKLMDAKLLMFKENTQ